MIGCNPMRELPRYACDSTYLRCPTPEQLLAGVVPLDSLPADWWNWMWANGNGATNEARTAITSLVGEVNTVLSCAAISPDATCFDQLYKALQCLHQIVATENIAGSVKSSSVNGNVSIDADGIMTANGLGNVSNLTTDAKNTVVAAINEVDANVDELTGIVGNLSSLQTTAKTSIVNAINELNTGKANRYNNNSNCVQCANYAVSAGSVTTAACRYNSCENCVQYSCQASYAVCSQRWKIFAVGGLNCTTCCIYMTGTAGSGYCCYCIQSGIYQVWVGQGTACCMLGPQSLYKGPMKTCFSAGCNICFARLY